MRMRWAGADRRSRLRRARGGISSGRFVFHLWLFISLLFLAGSVWLRNPNLLWFIPLPIFALGSLCALVFLHEAGHLIFGLFLSFPVTGIEIGSFPFRSARLGRFTCRVGRSPWSGRTVMGVSARTFSPARRFLFIAGGMIFEATFFLSLYLAAGNFRIVELLGAFLLLDQLVVNLFPRYEEGHALNDGALLLEILSPGSRAGARQARSVF